MNKAFKNIVAFMFIGWMILAVLRSVLASSGAIG